MAIFVASLAVAPEGMIVSSNATRSAPASFGYRRRNAGRPLSKRLKATSGESLGDIYDNLLGYRAWSTLLRRLGRAEHVGARRGRGRRFLDGLSGPMDFRVARIDFRGP